MFAMRKLLMLIMVCCAVEESGAQQVDSIYFHLYTDSLKKGFYNYINVDGKLSDGTWMPLDSNHVQLTSDAGPMTGNDLFIDSSYTGETVRVKARLRANPKIWKEVTIHIRKRGFDEPLPTNGEILSDLPSRRKKRGLF